MTTILPHPILSDTTHADIEGQIKQIADDLIQRKDQIKDVGLLSGKCGITLLFAYLSKVYTDPAYTTVTFDLLEQLGESLANEELDHNISSGLTGIAFVFQHLRNMNVIDKSEDLNLGEIDEFISRGIDYDFATENWDPLHGMTGLGIYFLERNKENGDTIYLEKIVDHLSALRMNEGPYKLWMTKGFGRFSNDNFNFGMAHGMPGIISFLAQVYERGIKQAEIKEMLENSIPYLLENEFEPENACRYPFSIDVKNPAVPIAKFSRLGWCYGDLSLALMLIHSGRALKNAAWTDKGLDIALLTTKRNFENSGCDDAPFCHGTTGLIHQYHRLFQSTGNTAFKQAADKWYEETIQRFYKPTSSSPGYSFFTYDLETEKQIAVVNDGLLEGNAGIALIYLSYIYQIKPDWDILFLTNV
ncbi:MAG: lanthionine synthetase C family protein [Bacteroidetes bacterium]|nr:lanthionine synthetase C family protein [Bacteroidota bacterium]